MRKFGIKEVVWHDRYNKRVMRYLTQLRGKSFTFAGIIIAY